MGRKKGHHVKGISKWLRCYNTKQQVTLDIYWFFKDNIKSLRILTYHAAFLGLFWSLGYFSGAGCYTYVWIRVYINGSHISQFTFRGQTSLFSLFHSRRFSFCRKIPVTNELMSQEVRVPNPYYTLILYV